MMVVYLKTHSGEIPENKREKAIYEFSFSHFISFSLSLYIFSFSRLPRHITFTHNSYINLVSKVLTIATLPKENKVKM